MVSSVVRMCIITVSVFFFFLLPMLLEEGEGEEKERKGDLVVDFNHLINLKIFSSIGPKAGAHLALSRVRSTGLCRIPHHPASGVPLC